jgi:hypothetical protein
MGEVARVSVPAKPLRKELTQCHLGRRYGDEVEQALRGRGGILQWLHKGGGNTPAKPEGF